MLRNPWDFIDLLMLQIQLGAWSSVFLMSSLVMLTVMP
jgi:hypothetical protein